MNLTESQFLSNTKINKHISHIRIDGEIKGKIYDLLEHFEKLQLDYKVIFMIDNVLFKNDDVFTVYHGLTNFTPYDVRKITSIQLFQKGKWVIDDLNDLPFYVKSVGDFVKFKYDKTGLEIDIKSNGVIRLKRISDDSDFRLVINHIKELCYPGVVLELEFNDHSMYENGVIPYIEPIISPLLCSNISTVSSGLSGNESAFFRKKMHDNIVFMTLLQSKVARLNANSIIKKLPNELMRLIYELLFKGDYLLFKKKEKKAKEEREERERREREAREEREREAREARERAREARERAREREEREREREESERRARKRRAREARKSREEKEEEKEEEEEEE